MTDDEPPRTLDVTATLARVLAGLGVEATAEGPLLRLPRGVRARAMLAFVDPEAVQLEILLELWPGTIVIESCVGFGPTEEARIEDAWGFCAAASLPVLMAAFLYVDTDDVEREAWEVDGSTRAVTLGPVLARGLPLDTAGWEAAVRAMVEDSTLPEGTHWIRAFTAIEGDRVLATEVLLDNQPWTWGQEQLAAYEWAPVEGRASARLFFVVQGGLDIGRAVGDLITFAELEDAELEERMVARGVDADDAAMLTALIPLAFGRRLLGGAGLGLRLADEAVVVEGPGRAERTLRLEDDPVFAEAAWLAEEGALSREQFLAVARRSAEVHAAEQLMEQGQDLSTIGMKPPVIERP